LLQLHIKLERFTEHRVFILTPCINPSYL